MIYRLFENITYENGDFERKVLRDYIHLKDGLDMLKLHEKHWADSRGYYVSVKNMAFDLLEVE